MRKIKRWYVLYWEWNGEEYERRCEEFNNAPEAEDRYNSIKLSEDILQAELRMALLTGSATITESQLAFKEFYNGGLEMSEEADEADEEEGPAV